ncbi:MAG: MBL fold metallo-hydrolase [bacterium]|nr:MBL fold metallo-hydrolase [bacterium]
MYNPKKLLRSLSVLFIIGFVFISHNDTACKSHPLQKDKGKPAIEVTYIANAGFMIKSGDENIMFDALNKNPWGYHNTPDDFYDRMLNSKAPFDDISTLLISHPHDDHYNTEMVSGLLKENLKIKLLSSILTENRLKEELGEAYTEIQSKIITADPEWGSSMDIDLDGVKCKVLTVDHSDKPENRYKTLSFLLEMNGIKILYVGDLYSPNNKEYFKKYQLQNENIDLAFLDCYFLLAPEGQEIIDNHIQPDNIVVTHMRPSDFDGQSAGIKQKYPDAIILKEPGEKKTVVVKKTVKR